MCLRDSSRIGLEISGIASRLTELERLIWSQRVVLAKKEPHGMMGVKKDSHMVPPPPLSHKASGILKCFEKRNIYIRVYTYMYIDILNKQREHNILRIRSEWA
jgi:hypothetical protein